jgi:hypothetical protein
MTPMSAPQSTPMSAPQSTWRAGSYPCFRTRCESGLRVVDAKISPTTGRLTQPMDMFTCQHCTAAPEPLPDSNLVMVRHGAGCEVLIAQTKARWPLTITGSSMYPR